MEDPHVSMWMSVRVARGWEVGPAGRAPRPSCPYCFAHCCTLWWFFLAGYLASRNWSSSSLMGSPRPLFPSSSSSAPLFSSFHSALSRCLRTISTDDTCSQFHNLHLSLSSDQLTSLFTHPGGHHHHHRRRWYPVYGGRVGCDRCTGTSRWLTSNKHHPSPQRTRKERRGKEDRHAKPFRFMVDMD